MAFCSNCGKKVDDTKQFCPACGNKLEGKILRDANRTIEQKEPQNPNPSAIPSSNEASRAEKFKFKKSRWGVYSIIGVLILLVASYFIFDPFQKEQVFAEWGNLSHQGKVNLVTDFKEKEFPDLQSPTVEQMIEYGDLVYNHSSKEEDTISSVLTEFIEYDSQERIAAIAALSGDVIEEGEPADSVENKADQIKTPSQAEVDILANTPEKEEEEMSAVDMERYMDSYFTTMVSSINNRDLSISETVLDPAGKAYPEHRQYLEHLKKKGITEEYLGVELIDFEETVGGYYVTTKEAYNIYYGDGSGKYKSFQSEFLVSSLESGLKVHTLLNTKELVSIDL